MRTWPTRTVPPRSIERALCLGGALALSACAPAPLPAMPTPAALLRPAVTSAYPTLPPAWTATFTATPTPSPTITPSATATPTPSPTVTPSVTATPTRSPTPSRTPVQAPTLWPGLAPTVIGYSVEGRPLEVYAFGAGPRQVMVVAGIHGGSEWNTIHLAHELMNHVARYPGDIPAETTLFVLPNLNPDGYARARGVNGRVNANGVDLNRNWPTFWLADWPRAGCWVYRPVTGGAGPASEPEVQALMAFILAHNLQGLFSYHSAALGIFAGGHPHSTAGSVQLAQAVSAVSGYAYPPIDTGCLYTGQFADWAANQGIPTLDIELTNHYDTDFRVNLAALRVLLNGW